jgi:STE24 endopeptidase
VNERLGLGSDGEILVSVTFVFILNVFNTVTSLPFSVYSTFVLEEK